MLPTPVELRELSRLYREAARLETIASRKRQLAACALALAQIAEAVERDGRIDEFVKDDKLRYLLAGVDATVRQIVGKLLTEQCDNPVTRAGIIRWRVRAAELQSIAEQFFIPSAQEGLLKAADSYERLADAGERSLALLTWMSDADGKVV